MTGVFGVAMATEVVEVVRNKKKGTRRKGSLPKLVCFHPVVDGPRFDRGVPEIEYGEETGPTHLVVMVNGIIGRLIARHLLLFLWNFDNNPYFPSPTINKLFLFVNSSSDNFLI